MSNNDNILYYGDNLDILKRYIKDESVDLVYLDPPFQSGKTYNILFQERDGNRSAAQIKAFEDTWRWDQEAAKAYQEAIEQGGKTAQAMQAFRMLLGESDMLAYISMMAPRLLELRRVMKPTASIYLHCDPTASHYLKSLMDAVFGSENFLNEIIWKRTSSHNRAKRWGPIHDVILFYGKTSNFTWNRILQDFNEDYVETFYKFKDEKGVFRLSDLTGPGSRTGDSGKAWREIELAKKQRHWEPPPDRALPDWFEFPDGYESKTIQERLDILDAQGLIYWPNKKDGMPSFKRYMKPTSGAPIQDIIDDIPPIPTHSIERLGYPTQKPVELLERILAASSDEGDVILDPFCGCGTTIAAAQKLNRKWIGIDITHLAVTLIKERLRDSFNGQAKYKVLGEPVSLPDAQSLAKSDPYQFQWWALGLVHARPAEQKKGSDKGIDGRLYFHDETTLCKSKQVIISVKSGAVNVAQIRDLRGVVEREKAEIGVLITLQEPTKPMLSEVAGDFYHSPGWNQSYPKFQILTIEDLLNGKSIQMPPQRQVNVTFKKARNVKRRPPKKLRLF